MEHSNIEANNLVERYVLGRLSEPEETLFEDHYADCAQCLEAVEAAQDLAPALREIHETTAPATPHPRFAAGGGRTRIPKGWWALAAAALVALAPSIWLAQRNASLESQLETLRRPWLSAPSVVFQPRRGEERDVRVVHPQPGAPWLSLGFELGDVGELRLSARLESDAGQLLWQGEDLEPSAAGFLQLALPAELLIAGDYVVHLQVGDDSGRRQPAGSFRFRRAE